MHTVFITGCASGFGHRLAARLLAEGHRVVATDPSLAAWPDDLGAPHDRLQTYALDVRDATAVRRVAAAACAWSPVDVLVNNAGYAIFGTQEETDLEVVADLFDVNVLGAARVTQALLGSLRQHAGLVVQLSSVAGRTVFPESGFYAATKYALEAMSEALLQETATFGLRLRLIEPGSFNTRFLPTAVARSGSPPADSPYTERREVWNARKGEVLVPPQDPGAVVDAIMSQLDDPRPIARVPVGPDAVRLLGLKDALAPDVWSRFAADRNGLHGPHLPGEVLSIDETLALPPDSAELASTRQAAAHGHLVHWAHTESGRLALAHVAHRGAHPTDSGL